MRQECCQADENDFKQTVATNEKDKRLELATGVHLHTGLNTFTHHTNTNNTVKPSYNQLVSHVKLISVISMFYPLLKMLVSTHTAAVLSS